MRRVIAAGLLMLATAATAVSAQRVEPIYHKAATIPMPDGRWDLLSVDPAHDRLMIGRADSVTLINLKTGGSTSAGRIVRGHAAVAIEDTDLVAVTSGGDNSVRLINATTGQQTASIPVGENPDAAFYEAASKRLIVMNARSGTVSIIDPRAARVTGTISVKPGLELGTLIAPDMLAINNEDAGEIELVDLKRGAALAPIALIGCNGPTGIAFDQTDELLLSACANGEAALVDARSHRLIELVAIGKGPDGALFDPRRRRFMVPCGQSGSLSVFAVGRNRHLTSLGIVSTEVGARTAALDARTGRIYLPAASFAPAAVPNGRPTIVAGSVHVLVLEPSTTN